MYFKHFFCFSITSLGVADPIETGCTGIYSQISGCTDSKVTGLNASVFGFSYWTCLTPVVTSISPSSGSTSDTITFQGSGFSDTKCQNKIYIGEQRCDIQTSSENLLTCKVNAAENLTVGKLYPIKVIIANRGEALLDFRQDAPKYFGLIPSVTAVTPSSGSIKGGTIITISGDGYSGNNESVTVDVGTNPCSVKQVSYTQVICETFASIAGNADVLVKVDVEGQQVPSVCKGSCSYRFENSLTAKVTSITPDKVEAPNGVLTLTGSGFGSSASDFSVMISDEKCSILSVSTTTIQCTMPAVIFGSHPVKVLTPNGYADVTPSTVYVLKAVHSIEPAQGGTNGGTRVTITGSGFAEGLTTAAFNGVDCEFQSEGPGFLVCLSPPNPVGSINVVPHVRDRPFQWVDFSYTDALNPRVTVITPEKANPGDTVTLSGYSFGTDTSEVSVMLGDAECSITSATDSSITCIVGEHPGGTVDVEVVIFTRARATSTSVVFTYDLSITSVSPSQGQIF